MKRLLSILLVACLAATILCGCNNNTADEGEGLTITFNDEQGEMPKQTEPIEPLNKALKKHNIDFVGDMYGAIINNADESDVKAANVDTYEHENGSETIIVMPYYTGSDVLVESVVYDVTTNGVVPVETLYKTTSKDDYALVLKVDRPDGALPELRVTVKYGDDVYSNLIKKQADSEIEYIR